MLPAAAVAWRGALAQAPPARKRAETDPAELEGLLPDKVLLKDYRPKSVYKVMISNISKAKHPAVDMHYHARAKTTEDVDNEVKLMDAAGIERTIVFAGTGPRFDESHKLYSKYPKRFDVWCGLDLRDSDKLEFGSQVVKELERCHSVGARGIGELVDKGRGFGAGFGGAFGPRGAGRGAGARTGESRAQRPSTPGVHVDDPKLDPVWERCAQLGMPANVHVSDPYWGYLKQDYTNDGLMNGFRWRLDNQTGIMGHNELIATLENVAKKHPKTVFVAAHLVNLDYDLTRLGQIFDRHPNLYADISARFQEISPIPRFASQFIKKYAHRVVYGTDMGYTQEMFSNTFRILESADEHFYNNYQYHWPLHGLNLADDVLRKIYRETALNAIKQAQSSVRG